MVVAGLRDGRSREVGEERFAFGRGPAQDRVRKPAPPRPAPCEPYRLVHRGMRGDAGVENLVKTEEEHGLESRLRVPPRPVEQPGEQVAKGREAAHHPGRKLPCEGAFTGLVHGSEMLRDGGGKGTPAVQHVVDDAAGGVPGAGGRSGRRGLLRSGLLHPGIHGLPGPPPSCCPGARRWPFRNSRAVIGRFPGR